MSRGRFLDVERVVRTEVRERIKRAESGDYRAGMQLLFEIRNALESAVLMDDDRREYLVRAFSRILDGEDPRNALCLSPGRAGRPPNWEYRWSQSVTREFQDLEFAAAVGAELNQMDLTSRRLREVVGVAVSDVARARSVSPDTVFAALKRLGKWPPPQRGRESAVEAIVKILSLDEAYAPTEESFKRQFGLD